MAIVLTAAAIVASIGIGVWSELRWPRSAVAAGRRALLITFYVVMPPLYFVNLAAAKFDLDAGAGILLALLATAIAAAAAGWIAGRFLHLARPTVGAVVVSVLAANTGFLGFPLVIAVLGRDELPTAVLYDALVSGPTLLIGAFAVAAAFGTRAGQSTGERVRAFFTRNPLLYAAILGLLAPSSLFPADVVDVAELLLIALLPVGFFAVGATVAEDVEKGTLPIPPPLTPAVLTGVLARLVAAPLLLFALAAPLIDLPPAYRLLIAMPTGINVMAVAYAYGLDSRTLAEVIVWTTAVVIAVALISLPF